MSELKATPGPWVYRDGSGEIGTVDRSDTQSYGMMLVVAHIDKFDHAEHEANAHLIAASRDLYEELQAARDTVQALIDDGYIGYVSQRDNIDSVLAGARGDV